MPQTLGKAFNRNFLGNSPAWYKFTILAFLVLNPILLSTVGSVVTGWILIVEFIFTLAMALKCYPLPAGGLLAIEAVVLGLTNAETVYHEVAHNLPVILLLMFMVAGIYFMKELLHFTFTKILMNVQSKVKLALLFCISGAVLSAFLDALTVTAVIIAVSYGFYDLYHRYASGKGRDHEHDCRIDSGVDDCHRNDLDEFRGFLRNLMMHGAVGTALGGVCTLVGEPQNLLIGHEVGWHFAEFFIRVAPVSLPVLAVGLYTCYWLEKKKFMGYGFEIPENVLRILREQSEEDDRKRSKRQKAALIIQGIVAVLLVFSLALHVAEVGVVGLMIIILLTSFTGVTEEHQIGKAFEEALPFTALLVVFFAVVAVIHDQHLFTPIIHHALAMQGKMQLIAFYIANGVLSAISDNVFVATVYITEAKQALAAGIITKEQLDLLAVAINTGTNIPSVATPNGQAAFLFLLTSALAPLIRLSYGQMVKLAFPYTVTMSLTGLIATILFL
ncbi:sodium/proton antiporter NhaB [Desulfovibrio inopinatus]|uniref:sodium/proton antiporter NhaB n=1 Tax=Desulfovibrio inopinatus TaxID=102109 RepID=UPI00040379F8|nr:sodium/proton antiporter NhaB [Desulfovibrio inopinatus]